MYSEQEERQLIGGQWEVDEEGINFGVWFDALCLLEGETECYASLLPTFM
jgi:hypothetical protein